MISERYCGNWWLVVLTCLAVGASLRAQEGAAPPAAPAPAPVPEASPAPSAAPAESAPVGDAKSAATSTTPAAELPAKAAKPVIIPFDEQAYRVQITLGMATDVGLTPSESRRVDRTFASLIESRMGKCWQADIQRAPAGEPRSRSMLESIRPYVWNSRMEPTAFDKRFALTIDRVGTAFRISGVEWDRSSQTTTQIQSRQTYDRRLLPMLAADLTFSLFRPLMTVESTEEKSVILKIRGGEYMSPDEGLRPFTVGEYISPYLRTYGKKKELLRVQHIPWTMVRVDYVERGYVKGTLISAFASPLAGKRRRVELLGIKVNPEWPSTVLKVIPRGKPESPMAGYRVEVVNRVETKEDKVDDRLKLRTNRNGEVVIPADPAHPLQYLVVYSGSAPIAKAPIVPGHERRSVLSAPDDAPRLNVEAETELLQSELIDIVAKREVLMARARGAAKKGSWDLVTELTAEVTALPTLEQLQTRIETMKVSAIQAAKRNKDKGQESRIVRMCKQVSDMATQHLDPAKVKEFMVEIEEEKKNR